MLNPTPVNMQAVPQGLEQYKQFINWRLVPDRKKPGKFKKLPCDIAGNVIDAHNPAFWLTAAEAATSMHGLAFVFTRNDPFWFLDLDHALVNGQWSELAKWCLNFFPGCAVEISHSGEGLHLFGYGSHVLPPDHGCKNVRLGVELYTDGRFVALTGTQRAGSAFIDYSDRMASFVAQAELTSREMVEDDGDEYDGEVDPAYTGPADDGVLIAMMCGSKGSLKTMFGANIHPKELWEANEDALAAAFSPGEPRPDGRRFDWSSADASLLWHLSFWTGRDEARMMRIFEQWKLYRPDHYEGKGAYRAKLLLKQARRNPGVYNKPAPNAAVPPIAPGAIAPSQAAPLTDSKGRSLMDLTAQVEHFKGCVYVQASHAVMVPDGRLLEPKVFNAVYGGFVFQMEFAGTRPSTEAFKCFTESRMYKFPKVIDICFRPDLPAGAMITGAGKVWAGVGTPKDVRVNTWKAPVIDEAPGDVTRFLDHVRMLLPDPRDQAIFLTYMQSLVRNPGKKFQWAPVIQGVQGNGKSMLMYILEYAVGLDYCHRPKASQITEKYNSWIEGRLFIGVEEIKIADRREVLEDLKDTVTNKRVEVRKMQTDKRMVDNFTNWLFCTNHQDAIPINSDERRYAIFFTAQQSKADLLPLSYFKAMYDWLDAEGYRFVSHWLRNAPLVDPQYDPAGDCQRAPETSSTLEAITASLGRVEQEIMEAVETGLPGFRQDWVSTSAVGKLLDDRGVRSISNRKTGDILKSLGYTKLFRSPRKIGEENGGQPMIYGRKGKTGSIVDYCIAQGYSMTLVGLSMP